MTASDVSHESEPTPDKPMLKARTATRRRSNNLTFPEVNSRTYWLRSYCSAARSPQRLGRLATVDSSTAPWSSRTRRALARECLELGKGIPVCGLAPGGSGRPAAATPPSSRACIRPGTRRGPSRHSADRRERPCPASCRLLGARRDRVTDLLDPVRDSEPLARYGASRA